MAVAISADLQMKTMLTAELDSEYAHSEFLFRQRPQTGKLLLLPPTLTQEPGKHICYMVTRTREFMNVSMPLKDSGRGHIDVRDFNAMLALTFAGTEICVHLHDRVYLTTVW